MTEDMRDPVCGMQVDPERSRFSYEHDGQVYYFCCGGCQAAFKTDPSQFLTPSMDVGASGSAAGPSAVDPVCGMTVDPATATVSHDHAGRT